MVIKNKYVMVIDDDPSFTAIIRAILEDKGMDVVECNSIAEARKAMETNLPNLILLDMELPGENGADFLKERAISKLLADIPVIVCSSHNEAKTVKEAIRFGANDYLLKPIKQTWLLQRVRKCLMRESREAYFFNDDEEIELLVDARAISITDTGFVASSSTGFEINTEVVADISSGDKAKSIVTNVKVDVKSRYHAQGPFITIFKVSGITVEENNRVQMLKAFWKF